MPSQHSSHEHSGLFVILALPAKFTLEKIPMFFGRRDRAFVTLTGFATGRSTSFMVGDEDEE